MNGCNVNDIDILIIGAGPIGLASALWFSKQSYNVLVIEQYSEIKCTNKMGFNERHQQIALDSYSINFLKNLDIVIWGEIKRKGCVDEENINIPTYILQNILIREIKNYPNTKILYDTKIESVTCIGFNSNCRIILVKNNNENCMIYGVLPRLVVVADGKHDDRGVAKTFFGFSSACKVHMSTYGIVGMIERQLSDNGGSSVCLKNYTTDSYKSDKYPELGCMYLRLLGNMNERYIALGLSDIHEVNKFLSLSTQEIKILLVEAYNNNRDLSMGEPELEDFTSCSKTPIPIVLDYRKETIKLLEGSSTIVTIEGDAARKTTFFSGSGLNTGYKALDKLFDFCRNNQNIIMAESNCLLTLDQKLLEKDQDCMKISYELLIKGIHYINKKEFTKTESVQNNVGEPEIFSLSPSEGQVPWFVHIKGQNLMTQGGLPPNCIFEWNNGITMTSKVTVYDNNTIGVKIPSKAKGNVSIVLERSDGKIVACPIKYKVVEICNKPEIHDIYIEDEWLCIDGKNFDIPSYVNIYYKDTDKKIEGLKAYCYSVNSLLVSLTHFDNLKGPMIITISTSHGISNNYIHNN